MKMETERDEFQVQEELRAKRRKIKDLDDLFELIRDVNDNYNDGYGIAPRAIAQASVATAYYLLHNMGCTGFQASCVMWDFVTELIYTDNKVGLKIIDFDLMIYPQYKHRFTERTLSERQWEALQKEAMKNLSELDDGFPKHPDVVAHWKSIVAGKVPFGFNVKEEKK